MKRLTIIIGIYIVISAAFMLQVNMWLTARVGDQLLFGLFRTVSVVVLAVSLAHSVFPRPRALRISAVLLIFGLAYMLGLWQSYFEERTHILMYGLLGYLAARDLTGSYKTARPGLLVKAALFVAFISACDETFQLALPYRFGEIKDFVTNLSGGILGIALFIALRKS